MLVQCELCEQEHNIDIVERDYHRWQQGELLQRAMPYLNKNERELLMSGICGTCFDRLFADETAAGVWEG